MKTTPTISNFMAWAGLAVAYSSRELGHEIGGLPLAKFRKAWKSGMTPAAFARACGDSVKEA